MQVAYVSNPRIFIFYLKGAIIKEEELFVNSFNILEMVCRCCVPNCPFKDSKPKLRRFPADPHLYLVWLNSVNRPDLYKKDQKTVRENYRICDNHFHPDAKYMNNRNSTDLKRDAVPTLMLNDGTPQPASSKNPLAEHCLNVPVPDSAVSVSSLKNFKEKLLGAPQPALSLNPVAERCLNVPVPDSAVSVSSLKNSKEKLLDCKTKKTCFVRQKKTVPKKISIQRKLLKNVVSNMKNVLDDLNLRPDLTNEEYLNEVVNFAESEKFIKGKLNPVTYKFFLSQINQQCKKSKGRRFDEQDKIFAMSLLKQSPKEYKLLQKTFALPSRKTITRVLKDCYFSAGINPQILQTLKAEIAKMNKLDRYCLLVFDEISIEPGFTYKKEEDIIYGLEEVPKRKRKFADHAMVFLIRGVGKKWKQPISFYFSQGAMNAVEVAVQIKKTICALQDIGLCVVGTVFDQYNSASINYLINQSKQECLMNNVEFRSDGFFVNRQEIITLYDVPHLLKGLRNNLLNKNLKFKWRKDFQAVSWDDIILFYELDSGDFDTKMCNRLTDEHIYPDKMRKMKVKHAAQVFSQRVSASIKALLKFGDNVLPSSAEGTADFLLFVDKLFDSLNGSVLNPEPTKPLRCAIQSNSPHHKFYIEARKVLQSITYFDKNGYKTRLPPTIPNFIKTIKGVEQIWKKLQQVGFKFLFPRQLNQDVLENLFSVIRSHGYRNINPTCTSFQSSFKSCVVNNFVSGHSPHANCEEDICTLGISSVQLFLEKKVPVIDQFSPQDIPEIESLLKSFKPVSSASIIIKNQHAFIAGYIAKQTLKKIGRCHECKKSLLGKTDETFHTLINFRSRGSQALLKPNAYFRFLFTLSVNIVHHFLPKLYHHKYIKRILTFICKKFITKIFFCKTHDLLGIYLDTFLNFYIFTWVKNVNRVLRGKSSQQINDEVKVAARNYYITNKSRKKGIQNIKKTVLTENQVKMAIF